jgi:hypothetical protein
MSIECWVSDAFQFHGIPKYRTLTPQELNQIKAYVLLQQRIVLEKRKREAAEGRLPLSGVGGLMDQVVAHLAPPPVPVHDLLQDHLSQQIGAGLVHRGEDYRGQHLDFVYPDTRVCIRIGEDDFGDDYLRHEGWTVVRMTEAQIRRQPAQCARRVKLVRKAMKKANDARTAQARERRQNPWLTP